MQFTARPGANTHRRVTMTAAHTPLLQARVEARIATSLALQALYVAQRCGTPAEIAQALQAFNAAHDAEAAACAAFNRDGAAERAAYHSR